MWHAVWILSREKCSFLYYVSPAIYKLPVNSLSALYIYISEWDARASVWCLRAYKCVRLLVRVWLFTLVVYVRWAVWLVVAVTVILGAQTQKLHSRGSCVLLIRAKRVHRTAYHHIYILLRRGGLSGRARYDGGSSPGVLWFIWQSQIYRCAMHSHV